MYINDPKLGVNFSAIAEILADKEKLNLLLIISASDYLGIKNSAEDSLPQLPESINFAELINLVSENTISSRVAKDILAMIVIKDESPKKIAIEKKIYYKKMMKENSRK